MNKKINIDKIVWVTWWIGAIIVVLSWVKIVPISVGWFGFGLTVLSVVVQVIARKYWRPPKTELTNNRTTKEIKHKHS